MKTELTPAFILHQRPYRETSLLLDVFSQQFGRVSLIAKGVRKQKRSQQGVLQLYQPLLVSWAGYSELATVTAFEAASAPFLLKREATLCGMYINELLVKLLPIKEPESEIFTAYQVALTALEQADNNELALRLFEKQLLTQLGYGLVIDRDSESGQVIDDEQRYYYQPDSGLYKWHQQCQYPAISGRSLRRLQLEHDFDQQSLNEIKQLMRSVINFYLGGKQLQSRQLFSQIHKIN